MLENMSKITTETEHRPFTLRNKDYLSSVGKFCKSFLELGPFIHNVETGRADS